MIPKEVLKKVKQIEIRTRSVVNSAVSGAYSSAFKGNGMEFAEVREYQPGDDIRSIDWNVTAKMGSPYTKKFEEERELTVMLVVDASSSGEFGSRKEMKGEIMATISSLLAFTAVTNNDRVGLLIFTSKIEKFIPPTKGKTHVLRVIRELLYFKPEEKGTDLGLALEYLNKILTRRAVVFLISDFESGSFETPIKLLNRKHDSVAITVLDEREKELPDVGFIELEDAETGESILIDTGNSMFRKTFKKEAAKQSGALHKLFRRLDMDYVEILIKDNYDETINPLIEFFKKRAAKIRM
ncbi:MAG: DUF58 domain-containing protein [Fibrobacteria bacterium]|nr:DUF58 domain-containing protein [Fibrobacteria bacterium]